MKARLSTTSTHRQAPFAKITIGEAAVFLSFLIAISLACIGSEMPKFMRGDGRFFTLGLFLFVGIFAGCFSALIVFLLRRKTRPYYLIGLAIFFSLLFVFECVGIGNLEGVRAYFDESAPFCFSPSEKAIFIGACFLRFLGCFVLFAFGPYFYKKHRFDYIFPFIVIIALIAIVYSLCAEFSLYKSLFINHDSDAPIKSFFTDKQSFGRFLMLAGFALLVSFKQKPSIMKAFVIFLFIGFAIVCKAKTSVVLLVLAVIALCVFQIISNIRTRNVLWWFSLSILIALIAISIFLAILPESYGPLGSLAVAFRQAFNWAPNESTIYSRNMIWGKVWSVFRDNPFNTLFGFGDVSFNFIISKVEYPDHVLDYSHNALLETVGKGGIIQLVFILLFLIFIILAVCYVWIKKKRRPPFMASVFFVLWFVFGAIESWSFFDMFMDMIIWSALSLIPLLSFVLGPLPANDVKTIKMARPPMMIVSFALTLAIPAFFSFSNSWLYVLGFALVLFPQILLCKKCGREYIYNYFYLVIADISAIVLCLFFPKDVPLSYLAVFIYPLLLMILSVTLAGVEPQRFSRCFDRS